MGLAASLLRFLLWLCSESCSEWSWGEVICRDSPERLPSPMPAPGQVLPTKHPPEVTHKSGTEALREHLSSQTQAPFYPSWADLAPTRPFKGSFLPHTGDVMQPADQGTERWSQVRPARWPRAPQIPGPASTNARPCWVKQTGHGMYLGYNYNGHYSACLNDKLMMKQGEWQLHGRRELKPAAGSKHLEPNPTFPASVWHAPLRSTETRHRNRDFQPTWSRTISCLLQSTEPPVPPAALGGRARSGSSPRGAGASLTLGHPDPWLLPELWETHKAWDLQAVKSSSAKLRFFLIRENTALQKSKHLCNRYYLSDFSYRKETSRNLI